MYSFEVNSYLEKVQQLERVLDEKKAAELKATLEIEIVKGILSYGESSWSFDSNDFIECYENRELRKRFYSKKVVQMAFEQLKNDYTNNGFVCSLKRDGEQIELDICLKGILEEVKAI